MEFVKLNMTIQESAAFLRLVVESRGQRYVPTPAPWKEIREFFEARVDTTDTERYLRELERRKQAGVKLLRFT